ncbi:MAG: fibronectin type III domain-containing protein, partial [Planctomycetes bacterium]|nr:fibronectin type III domain-containing protein [Planctomycetota bacterium]
TSTGVTKASGSFATVSGSPATVSGLNNGTTYYFVVTALDAGSESTESSETSTVPMISTPQAVSASGGDTTATLSFALVNGAVSYKVYFRSMSGVTKLNSMSQTGSSSPITISGLGNGVTYYFAVTAIDGGSESELSNEVSATPVIAAPQNVSVVAGDKSATLSFASVFGATSYKIYSSTSSGVNKTNGAVNTTSTSPLTLTGLNNGTTYYFVVTALDAGSESSESSQVSATPVITAPQNIAVSAGDKSASVSFASVSGATSYKVYYSTSASVSKTNGTPVTGASSPIAISGLNNGTSYYFVVTALDAGSESNESSYVSTSPVISIPQNLSANAGSTSVTLSFDTVTGASGYTIYYSTSSAVSKTNGTPVSAATSPATVTGLTNGTLYYFVITANDGGSQSAESNKVSAKPVIGIPQNISVSGGNGSAMVSFTTVSGAIGYMVYYSSTIGVTKVNGSSATFGASPANVTGLTNGTTYYFVVTAYDGGSESSESAQVTTTPWIATPQNLSATSGNGQIQLSWTSVANASQYNLYRGTAPGVTTATGTKTTVGTTSTTITGLNNGTTYYFIVTAQDSTESSASSEVSQTPHGWAMVTSPTMEWQQAVWGAASNDVWAAGNNGSISHFNGTSWSAATSPIAANWSAIWGAAANDVWVVGGQGKAAHYDGTSWSEVVTGFNENLVDIWGFATNDIWALGVLNAYHWNGTNWSQNALPMGNYEELWGNSTNDIWAVGRDGVISHWNGTVWSAAASPSSSHIYSVWGFAANDVWAVGTGQIFHYDGTSWSLVTSPTGQAMYSIWGSSATDIWASTTQSSQTRLLRGDGSTWSLYNGGLLNTFVIYSFWGFGPNDIWAVGASGTIFRYQ